jgi:hypothetical protein
MADESFTHLVRNVEECFDPTFSFQAEAPENAAIAMSWDSKEGFWLSANREGCLHLAKFFAELGLRQHEDGYHAHFSSTFRDSNGLPEFSFERCDSVA